MLGILVALLDMSKLKIFCMRSIFTLSLQDKVLDVFVHVYVTQVTQATCMQVTHVRHG